MFAILGVAFAVPAPEAKPKPLLATAYTAPAAIAAAPLGYTTYAAAPAYYPAGYAAPYAYSAYSGYVPAAPITYYH